MGRAVRSAVSTIIRSFTSPIRDAVAYAKWAGKDLPTEAEWEFAARGGLDGAEFAWGDELTPGGRQMANTWQGAFPHENLKLDGYERTSPVTAFPPNGYGLYDMIGNVWEWTTDWYSARHAADAHKACCVPANPRGGREEASYDPCLPQHQDSAQGAQGRFASLRAELLPPLSSGRTSRGAGRQLDEPCRLPLHGRRGGSTAMTDANRQELGLLPKLVIASAVLLIARWRRSGMASRSRSSCASGAISSIGRAGRCRSASFCSRRWLRSPRSAMASRTRGPAARRISGRS